MQNIIETLLKKLEIKYRIVGKEVVIKCPFHNDVHASLNINKFTGKWGCWSCHASAPNLEGFLKRKLGNDVKLSDYLTDRDIILGKIDSLYHTSEQKFFEYENFATFTEVVNHEFKNNFIPAERSKEAMDYLTSDKRKLTIETIRKFGLMYSVSGDYVGRIIIPYISGGSVIGFNSRLITVDKSKGKDDRYRYCIHRDSFKEFIYGIEGAKAPCILVEGPFDLMWMKQIGYNNAISTLSTTIRPLHMYHLMKFKKIIFLFDNDQNQAGEKAVYINSEKLFTTGFEFEVYIGKLPEYKDPNDSTEDEIRASLRKLKRIQPSEELKDKMIRL